MSADPSGEGWEWSRIQTDRCPQCGQQPAARPPSTLGQTAIDSAAGWKAFLASADEDYLRANPSPDVWSPLQYGAHSRDMLTVFGDRILIAMAEEDPAVPWFDPGPEAWMQYNLLDPAELASDLDASAARLASIIADRRESDWQRTARRDGVDRFTVSGLACFAVHEAHHHLLDANGSI
jgi:hypothetical protein